MEEDDAANGVPDDVSAETNGTSDASRVRTANYMAAVRDAARRTSGPPTPRIGTAEVSDSIGSLNEEAEDGTPTPPPTEAARYPGPTQTAAVRLGEGDAYVSLGDALDDARICHGAALATCVVGPATGVDDAASTNIEALPASHQATRDVAPDPFEALYRNVGGGPVRHERHSAEGVDTGYPDATWTSATIGAALAAR